MMAATVVITCALKVRSETSRLFLAMRIWRVLTGEPHPCSRCCVTVSASDALVTGLKSERVALLVTELLLIPRLTSVPVSKYFWTATDERSCRCTSALVPVMKLLVCGVDWCAQERLPISAGSKLGGNGPIWVEPATSRPCSPGEGAAPATLDGPATTAVEAGVAYPPAWVLNRLVSAICGVYRCS